MLRDRWSEPGRKVRNSVACHRTARDWSVKYDGVGCVARFGVASVPVADVVVCRRCQLLRDRPCWHSHLAQSSDASVGTR
ncbi:hypothetical protein SAV14893_077170 [Streptomyces avermitilis]|uniref:Uncharacterized protein n=1 Tax=Streptomyces avermitilis TaxID=33903 RepID=A0A4D4M944_STRAX|nr:hypothetical protein SAV14893_077170 [Streptomyces avermitilis]GDY71313.1 hypothetical protein SAV31267_007980 [Streptomyces avermitilis]